MRVFRAVPALPATVEDFRSYRELGKAPPRAPGVTRDKADGVSVFNTLERVRKVAAELELGEWIVELELPDDGSVEIGPVSPHGHVTLWAPKELLVKCVVATFSLIEPGS